MKITQANLCSSWNAAWWPVCIICMSGDTILDINIHGNPLAVLNTFWVYLPLLKDCTRALSIKFTGIRDFNYGSPVTDLQIEGLLSGMRTRTRSAKAYSGKVTVECKNRGKQQA